MKSKLLSKMAKDRKAKMLKLLEDPSCKSKTANESVQYGDSNYRMVKSNVSKSETTVDIKADVDSNTETSNSSLLKESRKRTQDETEVIVAKKPKKQDIVTLMFSNIPHGLTNIKVHDFFKSRGMHVHGCRANYAMQIAFIDFNKKYCDMALALDGEEWAGFQLAVKVDEVPKSRPKIKKDNDRSEKDGRTLFITNLPFSAEARQVEALFKGVQDVRILIDKTTGRSKGTAFVQFETAEDMVRAHKAGDDLELDGRQLFVDVYAEQTKSAGVKKSENVSRKEEDSRGRSNGRGLEIGNSRGKGFERSGSRGRGFGRGGSRGRGLERGGSRGGFGRGGSRGRGFEKGGSRGGFGRGGSRGRGFEKGGSRGGFGRGGSRGRGFEKGGSRGGFGRGGSRGRGFEKGGSRGGFGRGGSRGRGFERGESRGGFGRGRSRGRGIERGVSRGGYGRGGSRGGGFGRGGSRGRGFERGVSRGGYGRGGSRGRGFGRGSRGGRGFRGRGK